MNLNDDLKWRIFMLNAIDNTVDMEHRLTTTIASSQVCQNWQNVLLSSSSIWGRLVLITGYHASECSEEILLRSGGALLCVDADLTFPDDMDGGNLAIFFEIIEDIWERVESLRVVMNDNQATFDVYKRMWTAFDKPAPFLHEFSVKNPDLPEEAEIAINRSLFKDQAPRLRIFDCILIKLSSSSSWLRNLSEVLTVLSLISTVEVLKISSYNYYPKIKKLSLADRPLVPIPFSLKCFNLVTTVDMFVNIWSQIARPLSLTSCTINQTICFESREIPSTSTGRRKARMMKALRQIVSYHDDLDPPPNLRTLFIDIDIVSSTIILKRGTYSEIKFALTRYAIFTAESSFLFAIDAIPSIYSNVTNLAIGSNVMNYHFFGDIESILLKMNSVRNLTLGTIVDSSLLSTFYSNCSVAVNFSESDTHVPLIFPNLRSIRVQFWTEKCLMPLREYLFERSYVLEAPIKYLYIELHSQDKPKESLFSAIPGLEVILENGKMD